MLLLLKRVHLNSTDKNDRIKALIVQDIQVTKTTRPEDSRIPQVNEIKMTISI